MSSNLAVLGRWIIGMQRVNVFMDYAIIFGRDEMLHIKAIEESTWL